MQSTGHDLPRGLELPLPSGAEWWYWLGGRPALDLVNTLRERWRRRVETLVTTDDLARWLVCAELVPAPARITRALLRDARDLREAIDSCVVATIAGDAAPRAALATIDDWLVYAWTRPQLALDGGVPVLGARPEPDAARGALGAVALDAARMLGVA